MILVVMGVSGSGKTSVGRALAERIGAGFLDADALHPAENVAKMARGTALEEADRAPWLAALAERIAAAQADGRDLVVACSALRRTYRDALRAAGPVRFVHLDGDAAMIARRIAARTGHFMPPGLLASQIAALEPPAGEADVLTLDAALPIDTLAKAAARWAD